MSLTRFLARRVAFAALLIFFASSAALILARIAPGDFTTEMLGDRASAEAMSRERGRLGLDRSVTATYLSWMQKAARFDFGTSFKYQRPVGPLVIERARNTALLAAAALAVATLVGLPAGTALAGRAGLLAGLARAVSIVALSSPPLVLALVLAWVAVRTGWLPSGGMTSAGAGGSTFASAADVAHHLLLPTLALALPLAATIERLQGREMLRALRQPAVLNARARGVSSSLARWRHAFRLAVSPVVAVYGLVAGSLLGGAFGVELVTAWPGLGSLTYDALVSRDVNLVAGCAALGAAFVAAATLAADVALAWLDPRVRTAR